MYLQYNEKCLPLGVKQETEVAAIEMLDRNHLFQLRHLEHQQYGSEEDHVNGSHNLARISDTIGLSHTHQGGQVHQEAHCNSANLEPPEDPLLLLLQVSGLQ